MMIDVLYLRSTFDPGGTENLLLRLFNYNQEYIRLHYALLKEGELIDHLQSDKNYYYPSFRQKKIDYQVLRHLEQIIKDNNIRIIHTHQLFELIYAVFLKLRFPTTAIFHTVHDLRNQTPKFLIITEILLTKIFVKEIFTVSKTAKRTLETLGYPSNKLEVLPNAVKLQEDYGSYSLSDTNHALKSINDEDYITCMIGTFRKEKDQYTIAKAYNILKKEIPNLKVLFIGKKTSYSQRVKQIINQRDLNNRVIFLGSIVNAAEKYLQLIDLFIMSTKEESFGISVVEAMLTKTPVIASDIPTMKEISKNGKYFELFETGNPDDLASKIKWFYDNRGNVKLEEKIERAYGYAKREFSFEKYVKKLQYHYTKAI